MWVGCGVDPEPEPAHAITQFAQAKMSLLYRGLQTGDHHVVFSSRLRGGPPASRLTPLPPSPRPGSPCIALTTSTSRRLNRPEPCPEEQEGSPQKLPWAFYHTTWVPITMSPGPPPPGTSSTGRSPLEIWQGLDAVQNLFAASLPWYESKLSKAGLSDASRSSLLDFRTFFRFDIRQLSMSLSSSHLSNLSPNQTRNLFARLDKVLLLLEARIDEHVLVLLSGQQRVLPEIAASPNEGDTGISSIFWAFSRFPAFFARDSSSAPSKQFRNTLLTPPAKSPYLNLEALQSLLGLLDADADPVFKYGHLINLGDGPDDYHPVLHEIEQLNEFLLTLGDMQHTPASSALKTWSMLPTDVLDLSLTREASSRLFNALVHSPVECGDAHRCLLHLTGFRPRDRGRTRPSWDMFLSCCSHPLGWLETHCTVWG